MEGLTKLKGLAARLAESRRLAAQIACAVAVIGTVALFNSGGSDETLTAQSAQQAATTQAQTQQTQKQTVVQFKKAPLSDYDMAQTQVRSSASANDKDDQKTDSTSFKIAPEQKDFSYTDKMNPSSPLYTTRDTSSEFFTVRDITTGKLVTMNAHELVCGIVYNEVGDGWGKEAIKAQAVAAYSCLRYSDSIGMIETVGIKRNYTPTIESCVRAVEGQVVMYGGNIANTLYSASTAGYSIPSSDIFISKYPYLTCVKSAYDNKDPNWGLKVTYTTEQVRAKLESKFKIKLSDDLKNWFKITDSRYGKYIFGLSIDSKTKTTGKIIAGLFELKSSAFDISYSNGKFTFTTYGWGHGVGMSQWGACMYARNGCTYDQILTHYYVGTKIGLSSVSKKAVERGKKSPQELEQEAQTATQTSADNEAEPAETSVVTSSEQEDSITTTTTAAPTTAPSDESSEPDEHTATKVTKSAENAE